MPLGNRRQSNDSVESTYSQLSVDVPPSISHISRQGPLYKRGGLIPGFKERYFILSNATLTYWKSKSEFEALLAPIGSITVQGATVKLRQDEKQYHCLSISPSNGSKTFVLGSNDPGATADWFKDIKIASRQNGTTRAGRNACVKCGVTFTIAQRRHTCRLCAGPFCSTCSSKTAAVRGNNVPVRVCDACYATVQRGVDGKIDINSTWAGSDPLRSPLLSSNTSTSTTPPSPTPREGAVRQNSATSVASNASARKPTLDELFPGV